ncbi:MAG: Cardiolipin synthase [Mycoplasmataceae bacterium]|nr:MAG: Cardiolipin synthase [Mycoplasmataceae bacterium]
MNTTFDIEENKKDENKWWLWIIGVFALIIIIGLIFYFVFSKSSKSKEQKTPDFANSNYLPSQAESEKEISKIKTSKNLDEQQATIEFLTRYVPHIKWWEINSLAELDEKINLVNSKCGFSAFKEVPSVDKFNEEVSANFVYRNFLFLSSIVPRKDNGEIDWKGLDFQTYCSTILEPYLKNTKFKPSFATNKNLAKLSIRLISEINPSLISICSGFSELTNADELNKLINNYLSKIFKGYVYSEIEESLWEQIENTPHTKYDLKETGNNSLNSDWNIFLKEFAFSQNP